VGGVQPIDPILEKLERAQTAFFRSADCVPLDLWSTRPGPEQWSAAELSAHLIAVERAIVSASDRVTQKVPRYIPAMKRFHLPMWLVETRIIRRKSPIPTDAALLGSKEEMLAELRGVRERSLAFLDETRCKDLSVYCWPHPFLGMLNVYEWFEMIAAHQLRHTKQMKEISTRLPKAVGNSQN
jgi:hypothetical protein